MEPLQTGQELNLKPRSSVRAIFEKLAETGFLLCAVFSVVSLLIIAVFIIGQGMPGMLKIGVGKFLTGQVWQPGAEVFGILPMILGTIYATLGATLIGVPIGILTAVFISEIAPSWLSGKVRAAVDLLAAIPSVVYGFFGLIIFVPMINTLTNGAGGDSLLAAILILSIMILPTITSITETSLRAVPDVYREGSLALGATHIQTIFKVTIPAAKSGIFSAVILGVGRAVGEAMAVILVSGNAPQIPGSTLRPHPHYDCQYRTRNGVRLRTAHTGTVCNRRSSLPFHYAAECHLKYCEKVLRQIELRRCKNEKQKTQ